MHSGQVALYNFQTQQCCAPVSRTKPGAGMRQATVTSALHFLTTACRPEVQRMGGGGVRQTSFQYTCLSASLQYTRLQASTVYTPLSVFTVYAPLYTPWSVLTVYTPSSVFSIHDFERLYSIHAFIHAFGCHQAENCLYAE